MLQRFYDPAKIPVSFRIRFVFILGITFCVIGAIAVILSVIELFHGRPKEYHYNESQGGLKIENPLWPSSGKGFWVGLILIATGFVGILASREWTPPAIIGFTALTSVSMVLSFYMIMTCIIPLYNDTTYSDAHRPAWQTTELAINSLLIAVGGIAVILGSIASLIGCCFAGCCANQRDDPRYSDEPNQILVVTPNVSRYGRFTGFRFTAPPRIRMPRLM